MRLQTITRPVCDSHLPALCTNFLSKLTLMNERHNEHNRQSAKLVIMNAPNYTGATKLNIYDALIADLRWILN